MHIHMDESKILIKLQLSTDISIWFKKLFMFMI